MPANSRMFDMYAGVTPLKPHPKKPPPPMIGIIMMASTDHTVENLGQARQTDFGLDMCKKHVTFIIMGSGTSKTNGLPKARVGDATVGGTIGVMVMGASTEQTGG